MKKAVWFLPLLCVTAALLFSGCSNEYEFADYPDNGITLTYEERTYSCISVQDCPYAFEEEDMVLLLTEEYGEFNDMGEAYRVYRHRDDETPKYLFVVPKPSMRDMIAVAFVLKLQDMAETSA